MYVYMYARACARLCACALVRMCVMVREEIVYAFFVTVAGVCLRLALKARVH